ncbi:hypothetical protein, unlikely [Trypanosoma congolense IL3000]|uniref:Uncharacterized protein n=1 Tax=Trypanosoma congolense (strain IL3000) TaxID=1068625 RepID=F9W3I2_TRYCI|nr:hypothetical protein, unlikely [Trypanosoma congolense IL3000]
MSISILFHKIFPEILVPINHGDIVFESPSYYNFPRWKAILNNGNFDFSALFLSVFPGVLGLHFMFTHALLLHLFSGELFFGFYLSSHCPLIPIPWIFHFVYLPPMLSWLLGTFLTSAHGHSVECLGRKQICLFLYVCKFLFTQ